MKVDYHEKIYFYRDHIDIVILVIRICQNVHVGASQI